MPSILYYGVVVVNIVFLIYFLILNVAYIALSLAAFWGIRNYTRSLTVANLHRLFQSTFYKPISILMPAYNEQTTIVDAIRSLLNLEYPEYELIVINDGSTDNTLNEVLAHYQMIRLPYPFAQTIPHQPLRGYYVSTNHPNLFLIDKENGGKSDALNAGINTAKYPVFCGIDADSLLDRHSILRVMRPFIEDPRTIAVGGIIRVVNGCRMEYGQVTHIGLPKNRLAKIQVVEYMRAFLLGRMGWSAAGGSLIISGAFGAFRKDVVKMAGGYRPGTVGEDMELVMRLHHTMRKMKKPYRVSFVPDPVCWTEVPETFVVLGRQRDRWQRGLLDSLWYHREMCFNPDYGLLGCVYYPFFLIFEAAGPLIEMLGYLVVLVCLLFGMVHYTFALLFFTVAVGMGVILSVLAVVLEEYSLSPYPRIKDVFTLFLYGILENFFYRQVTVYWRVRGIYKWFFHPHGWGRMDRVGFTPKSSP